MDKDGDFLTQKITRPEIFSINPSFYMIVYHGEQVASQSKLQS